MFQGGCRGLLIAGVLVTCFALAGGTAGLGQAADRSRVPPARAETTIPLTIFSVTELTEWDEIAALERFPELLAPESVVIDSDDTGRPNNPPKPDKPSKPNKAEKPDDQRPGPPGAGHPTVVPGTRFGPGEIIRATADVIGSRPRDVRRALKNGSTLAAIASQRGVARDALIGGLKDRAAARLRDRVQAGRLTQAEADRALAALAAHLPVLVDAPWPGRGHGSPGPPGRPADR